MSNLSSIEFDNKDRVGIQVASQIIHGSFYNTVMHNDRRSAADIAAAESELKTDDDLLASLAFSGMFDRRATIENPHPSTCQWIWSLDDFKLWQDAPQGLLWIKGKPGAGKSTLMLTMHAEFQKLRHRQQGINLDFFFNARGDDLQKTPLGMFRCLLNQLFVQSNEARPMIRKSFAEKHAAFGSSFSGWRWQEQELEAIFSDALLQTAKDVQTTVFIDALDEAGERNAQKLARFFHKLNDKITSTSRRVKICISCRHYPFVSKVKATEIWVENHNGKDIATFVHDRLNIEAFDDDDRWQEQPHIENDLICRAGGVFQWVSLAVAGIERGMLRGESPETLRNWLQNVPQGLGNVYQQILQTQIDDADRAQSSLLFTLVCHAELPLDLVSISAALAATASAEGARLVPLIESRELTSVSKVIRRRLQTLSGGLVEELHGRAQLIHQSVHDFLTSEGFKLLFDLEDQVSRHFANTVVCIDRWSPMKRCQIMLHHCCLNYLAAIDPKLDLNFGCYREQLLALLPLVNYASLNLFIHAEKAAEVEHQDMTSYVHRLEAVLPRWMFLSRYLHGWTSQCPAPGSELVHIAAAHGLTPVIRSLVTQRTNVNLQDGHGYTALHIASERGSITMAQALIDGGADPAIIAVGGETVLHLPTKHGHIDFVTWMIRHDAYRSSARVPVTLIHVAAAYGRRDLVQLLLDLSLAASSHDTTQAYVEENAANCHVNGMLDSYQRETLSHEYEAALIEATRGGHIEVVKLLLRFGANPNGEAYSESTLRLAIEVDRSENIRGLLEAELASKGLCADGGRVMQTATKHGERPAWMAAVEGWRHPLVVENLYDSHEVPLFGCWDGDCHVPPGACAPPSDRDPSDPVQRTYRRQHLFVGPMGYYHPRSLPTTQ